MDGVFYRSMTDMSGARRSKMLNSTGLSNLHQGSMTSRLPELNRSRSFSSSSKSTKLKLTTLDATLSSLAQQLHELKMDTRVSNQPFSNRGGSVTS